MEPAAQADPGMTKDALRRAALARRDALDPAWRAAVSHRLAEEHGGAFAALGVPVVASFLPIRSEIDVRPLMRALARQGARLCLPAIVDARTILFRNWNPGDPLERMAFSTLGPPASQPVLDPDMILMPLAAFDGKGGRIGYGGGFYDRAIADMRGRGLSPRLVGVAFDCQRVQHVPAEPHDIALDEVLTESGRLWLVG